MVSIEGAVKLLRASCAQNSGFTQLSAKRRFEFSLLATGVLSTQVAQHLASLFAPSVAIAPMTTGLLCGDCANF